MAKRKFHLQEHTRSKHEGVVYPCDQCEYVTKAKKYLKEHIKSKHLGIQHNCGLCGKVFARLQYLRIHMKSVHGHTDGVQIETEPKPEPDSCDYLDNNNPNELNNFDMENHDMDSPEKYSENPDYNSNDGQINFFKYEGADGIKEECLENSKNIDKDYNENPSTEGEGIEVPINPEQLGIKLEGPLDSDDEGESGDIPPAFNPDQLLGMMKYECTQCDKVFARQQYLRIHIKSIHGGSNFACDLCDFTTNRKDGLKHHRESIHEGVVYPCDQCEYVANYKQRLKNHKLNVHLGVKFPCSTCDYVGNNAPALKYHLETAHSGLIFPCNMCDFVANGPINLKRHKKSQHETSARRPVLQLSCDQCDFVTKSAKWLEKHKNSEHDVVHECKHCFKVFARLQYLRIHVKAGICIVHSDHFLPPPSFEIQFF